MTKHCADQLGYYPEQDAYSPSHYKPYSLVNDTKNKHLSHNRIRVIRGEIEGIQIWKVEVFGEEMLQTEGKAVPSLKPRQYSTF